jgi:hypothetical protein
MAGPHDGRATDATPAAVETLALPPPEDFENIAIDAAMGADGRGLPPASAFVYVFEGLSER